MTEHRALTEERTGLAILVLSLGVFMSSLDLFIVNLAFPYISTDYPGSSTATLSWVLNGYTIVFAALLVPAGRYADRLGRRRVWAAGLIAFTAGSVLCGLAPGVGLLIAARAVQAVGAAMIAPASLSLLLAVVPPDQRAKAIGTWAAIGGMAAALGPVIGGPLVELSWRWVFWVNVPVGVLALVLTSRVLPESRDPNPGRRPDLFGAVLLAAAVGALCLAVIEGPTWGWLSVRVLGVAVLALLGLAAFAARSAHHPAPVIDAVLLRLRSFRWALIASVLFYAGFGAFVLNLVVFLTDVWGYSPVLAGLAIAPGPLSVLPFARVVAPRLEIAFAGPGRVAILGCLLCVTGQGLWLARMSVDPSYLALLLPSQLIGGAGVGLVLPSLLRAGTAALPPARFGTGSGIINTMRQLGIVFGVAGLIAVLTTVDPADPLPGFQHAVTLTLALFAVAGLASVVIGRSSEPAAPRGVTVIVE